MVFHDVSKERRLHRALHYQASPRCADRTHQSARGSRIASPLRVEEARQNLQARHVLLYLDLDQFKLVNDTCVTSGGRHAAEANYRREFISRVRGGDTLARLGGDEFGILLQDCSRDQALRIAENLRQGIRVIDSPGRAACSRSAPASASVEITNEIPTVANA